MNLLCFIVCRQRKKGVMCKKNGIKSKFSSQYNGKVNLQFIVMDGMVSFCLCSRVGISPKMSRVLVLVHGGRSHNCSAKLCAGN